MKIIGTEGYPKARSVLRTWRECCNPLDPQLIHLTIKDYIEVGQVTQILTTLYTSDSCGSIDSAFLNTDRLKSRVVESV